jgi:3,4-dihydroxy 2-butanone 4-phosphate synthase/GTP cyclohydrolase II
VFGSLRCDCGDQLDAALDAIAKAGQGVVIYLRGHEGRGIGLADKLRAYVLQDRGYDTVDANLALGLPVDARDYGAAADVLIQLGIRQVTLLTNNPDKTASLQRAGVDVVACQPVHTTIRPDNHRYLKTKRNRLRHQLSVPGHAGDPALDTA